MEAIILSLGILIIGGVIGTLFGVIIRELAGYHLEAWRRDEERLARLLEAAYGPMKYALDDIKIQVDPSEQFLTITRTSGFLHLTNNLSHFAHELPAVQRAEARKLVRDYQQYECSKFRKLHEDFGAFYDQALDDLTQLRACRRNWRKWVGMIIRGHSRPKTFIMLLPKKDRPSQPRFYRRWWRRLRRKKSPST